MGAETGKEIVARLSVRPLETHDEFRQCERIQRSVWGLLGASREVLQVTQKYGGVVLGAFVGGRMVGFLYAFLARRRGRLIHWSHMMAVERAYRDCGLGFQMKLKHRQLALAQGIESIAWTYDPLQSRNATLNLHRLGAQVEEYLVDCYGHFPSRIERGLPSDRLVVNWRIATAAVARRLTTGPPALRGQAWTYVNSTRLGAQGFIVNQAIRLGLRARRLGVEIPTECDRLRARAPSLARRWRFEIRRIFLHYLAAGYRVETFLPPAAATEGRAYYLLRAGPLEPTSDSD
jgi:predicted GNAT superfamily acetyltransferase